ncbi:MAG: DUF4330 domain-containing protein [Clostridia bacterium]|nr:DUF4330 domain-containing protein [Clostridia bacterium]
MFMDSKGKLFGKVSIIDALIVLIVLGAIAGVTYKFTRSNVSSPFFNKADQIELKFGADEVPDFVAAAVKESLGAPAKDPVQNQILGKIVDVKIEKARSYGNNEKGESVLTSKPGYSSIVITIVGEGKFTDEGASFGPSTYPVGRSMEVRFGKTAVYSRIQSLNKKG